MKEKKKHFLRISHAVDDILSKQAAWPKTSSDWQTHAHIYYEPPRTLFSDGHKNGSEISKNPCLAGEGKTVFIVWISVLQRPMCKKGLVPGQGLGLGKL